MHALIIIEVIYLLKHMNLKKNKLIKKNIETSITWNILVIKLWEKIEKKQNMSLTYCNIRIHNLHDLMNSKICWHFSSRILPVLFIFVKQQGNRNKTVTNEVWYFQNEHKHYIVIYIIHFEDKILTFILTNGWKIFDESIN